MVHRGIIKIDQKLILNFLQFPNGEILQARLDEHRHLELLITDTDMPEVKEGKLIPVVKPMYIKYQDSQGHWVAIRKPFYK